MCKSSGDLRTRLPECTFSKGYSNGGADLIIGALAGVYGARIFIHVGGIRRRPGVGVDFPGVVHLIEAGWHCGLLGRTRDIGDLPCNDEDKEESDCDFPKRMIAISHVYYE